MVDVLEQRLQALRPRCCLCSGYLDQCPFQPHLLLCGHAFCQYCLPELVQGVGLVCPFDCSLTSEMAVDRLCAATEWALKMQHHTDRARFKEALDQLESCYSLSKVPCKEAYLSGSCPYPQGCMYDHSCAYFRQFPCPLRENCWRGDLCLYFHTPQVSLSQHNLTIRSQSLLSQLEAQIPTFVSIVRKYQAQTQSPSPNEVNYFSQKQWVFEDHSNPLPIAFEPQAQADIQYALDHHKSFAQTNGFRVFFKPQFLITSEERVYRVTCTNVCTGTSEAGVLTFACEESCAEAFGQEILQLEGEVPGVVVGNRQFAWLKKWGLGLCGGQIIGERTLLAEAMRDKPEFDEYDDILETPFPFDPAIHSIAGKIVEVFTGKIVGLREDVIRVCTLTNAVFSQNSSANLVNSSFSSAQTNYQNDAVDLPRPRPHPMHRSSLRRPESPARMRTKPEPLPGSNPYPSVVPWTESHAKTAVKLPSRKVDDEQEVERVRALVSRMLPGASAVEVETANVRPSALRRFEQKKREMSLNGPILTKQLFHGTKHIDPRDIIDSDECMNSRRRSIKGKKGVYFYESVAAIENYSHKTSQGRRLTMLCEVLVGRALLSDPRSFRGAPEGFDSVQGKDRGSNLWVVYEDDRALPAYLITYFE